MKNIFTLLFISCLTQSVFSQINPVQNLEWNHGYDFPYNLFSLYWEEPEQPHDELIGYNIYREDELYRFMPEIIPLLCNPDFGEEEDCDFIFYNDGDAFTGYVAAVYQGGVESEYVSFEVEGVLLNTKEIASVESKIYPNPVQSTLHFGEKVFEISVFDLNGKLIKSVSEANSIDLNDLQKGSYMIQYQNSKGEIVKCRFLKK